MTIAQSPSTNKQSSQKSNQREFAEKKIIFFRNILQILIIIATSLQVRIMTMDVLTDSRQIGRALNYNILLHQDFDIYWFGFSDGQYLLNYPIHQYYNLDDVVQALSRMKNMVGNLDSFMFGQINQKNLNSTKQQIVVYFVNGSVHEFQWKIKDGIMNPFNQEDTASLKQCLVKALFVQIHINNIKIANKVWDLMFILEPFANSSIFFRIFYSQKLWIPWLHLPSLLLGMVLFFTILYTKYRLKVFQVKVQDFPDILLCFFILYSSIFNIIGNKTFQYGVIMDGFTCFISWLWTLKFFTHQDDYHISFLIKQSYILVGKLFVSFGPLFIAFCLFALTVFCRYADLFDNIQKTFISIFCVCYYNMTYEQFRATERMNPISSIFFIALVLIFTVCIYSGMLVSVFCSHIWNKREQQTKQSLIQMLKIECINCKYKYSYKQGLNKNNDKSQTVMQKNLTESVIKRLKKYRQSIQILIYENEQIILNDEEITEDKNEYKDQYIKNSLQKYVEILSKHGNNI